jgi:nucleotidyltransferase substrate binding protein (TIGR01987 family)
MVPEQKDKPWVQQFSDYRKAFAKLTIAINIFKPNEEENLESEDVDELMKEGLIRRFEYTHELACKVMKEYVAFTKNTEVNGAKDSTHEAYKLGLISDAGEWMDMLESRKEIQLLFYENTVEKIFEKILLSYYLLFLKFEEKMEEIRSAI